MKSGGAHGLVNPGKYNAVCTICTIRLVNSAYQRAPWFRVMRESLRQAIRLLAWAYRVDPTLYTVRTPACYGCIRFQKTALKERSGLFRWLNARINPLFDALLERIVGADEVQLAQRYARSATAGPALASPHPPDRARH